MHQPQTHTSPSAAPNPDVNAKLASSSEAALEWAIAKLGLTPASPGRRAILTDTGLAVVTVRDRFTEIAIERHWSTVADVLAGDLADQLAEFSGFDVNGHQLAFSSDQIPRSGGNPTEVE
jgi:hypothetical protein